MLHKLAIALLVIGLSLGSAIGLRAAFFEGSESGLPPKPTDQEREAQPPPPLSEADLANMPDFMRQATEAYIADRAKPRFEGEMGEFVVSRDFTGLEPVCPADGGAALYTDRVKARYGGKVDVGVCTLEADGLGIGYYTGRAVVSFDAPFERLKLVSISGRPAIVEVPASFIMPTRLMVIARTPTDGAPGIMMRIDTTSLDPNDDSYKRALDTAEYFLLDFGK